jgi:hypothetical protein
MHNHLRNMQGTPSLLQCQMAIKVNLVPSQFESIMIFRILLLENSPFIKHYNVTDQSFLPSHALTQDYSQETRSGLPTLLDEEIPP